MQLDFEDIFNDHVKSNQKEWAHDRSSTLGASEAFACIRKGWFEKFGEKNGFLQNEEEQQWGAMERGNVIENHYVVPAIRDNLPEGAKLVFAGENQKTFVDGFNSATPDGLIKGLTSDALVKYGIVNIEADCIVLEIKSVDPRVNLQEEKAIHHGQAQVQMGLIRELTKYKPVYAVILYIDASFLDNITVFVVRFDPSKWKAAQMRAANVFEVNDPGELRPEGKMSGECKYCRWTDACSAVTTGQIPEEDNTNNVSEDIIIELAPLVSEERAAKKRLDELEDEHKTIRQRIKEYLEASGRRKIKGNDWSVTWFSQDDKITVDTKRMREDGIDLTSYEKQGSAFDKLLVKETKPD